jgi:hypothetical protein
VVWSNGDRLVVVEGSRQRELSVVLDRCPCEAIRRHDIEIDGLSGAWGIFGVDGDAHADGGLPAAPTEVEGAGASG